jgi:arylsulfatase A-like enzyme
MNQLSQLLVGLPLLASLGSSCQEIQKQTNPNIIFILADDLGYGDVSALNENSKIHTPNLDLLASQGVVFTDAHSSSAVCTPTRYGILTGRYNWRSTLKKGVLGGYSHPLIPHDRKTMAAMLHEEHYNTACIGKWHLGWDWDNIEKGNDSVRFDKPINNGPTTLGFDYFYGICGSLDMKPYVYVENNIPTALPNRFTEHDGMGFWRNGPTASDFDHEQVLPNLIGRAVKYIEEKSKDKDPFFLYLPLTAPHTPILPNKEFRGKSGLNDYGDFVLMVDAMMGKVMVAIDQAGISNNTIVVFTSDNGCSPSANFDELMAKGHNPSYIYRGYKSDLFDGGHRIPCIVRWPAKVKHHKVNQTICLTDFMATFAAITGYKLKDSEGEDSFSLTPLLLDTGQEKYSREATVHHSIYGNFTIRKGEWKLLFSPSSGGWSYPSPDKDDKVIATLPPYQLYNMKTDPGESDNLNEKYPEVVRNLRELMLKYIEEGRSTPGITQKNDGKEIVLE